MKQHIERVDAIPLLLHCLDRTGVEKCIDSIWKHHGSRKTLTYDQLAVLCVVDDVNGLNHRLYQKGGACRGLIEELKHLQAFLLTLFEIPHNVYALAGIAAIFENSTRFERNESDYRCL